MPGFDYTCRRARPDDDLIQIARYIHETDPYIYPGIIPDWRCQEWRRLIGTCFETPGDLFSREHLFVETCDGRIVGLACVIHGGAEISFAEGIDSLHEMGPGMQLAREGYFEPLFAENRDLRGYNIVNFCVDPDHRGKGVGTRLMRYLIEELGTQDIFLDVIRANTPAVKLYENCGFVTVSEYMGFSGSDEMLPCLHMVRRA